MDRKTLDQVAQGIVGLLDENKPNLEDPSDQYTKGYHDALVDALKSIKADIPPEHQGYFD